MLLLLLLLSVMDSAMALGEWLVCEAVNLGNRNRRDQGQNNGERREG